MSGYTKFSDRFGKSELQGRSPEKPAKPAKVTPISYVHIQKPDKTLAGLAALAGGWGAKTIFEKAKVSPPSALSEATEPLQPEGEPVNWEAGLAQLDPDRPPRGVPRKRSFGGS